jgi:hypothetical protein
MKNIYIFSPEKDRKIAWYGSVIFLILAWLILASSWVWIIVWNWLNSNLGLIGWQGYCILAIPLLVLIVIPVQLVRYLRRK